MCTSYGVLLNPYAALPRHVLGKMVLSWGAKNGTKLSPRVLRASFCTSFLMEAALANAVANMTFINATGGWSLGSNEPMQSYCSARAMSANMSQGAQGPLPL